MALLSTKVLANFDSVYHCDDDENRCKEER